MTTDSVNECVTHNRCVRPVNRGDLSVPCGERQHSWSMEWKPGLWDAVPVTSFLTSQQPWDRGRPLILSCPLQRNSPYLRGMTLGNLAMRLSQAPKLLLYSEVWGSFATHPRERGKQGHTVFSQPRRSGTCISTKLGLRSAIYSYVHKEQLTTDTMLSHKHPSTLTPPGSLLRLV